MEAGDGDRAHAADADASAGGEAADPEGGTEGQPDGASAGADETAENGVETGGGEFLSLDPRVRYVWIVQSVISAAVFGAVVAAAGYFLVEDLRPGVAVFALVAVGGAVHSLLRFRVWRYQVREESLYLERGVFTRVKTVIPYVRIQHVDAARGPTERLAGLATAVVYTAGSRGADVSIPGLSPEDADDLQQRLERLAIAAETEDAV